MESHIYVQYIRIYTHVIKIKFFSFIIIIFIIIIIIIILRLIDKLITILSVKIIFFQIIIWIIDSYIELDNIIMN